MVALQTRFLLLLGLCLVASSDAVSLRPVEENVHVAEPSTPAPALPVSASAPPHKLVRRAGPPPPVSVPRPLSIKMDKRSTPASPALPVTLPKAKRSEATPPALPVTLPKDKDSEATPHALPVALPKDKRSEAAPPAPPALPVTLPKDKRSEAAPPALPVTLPKDKRPEAAPPAPPAPAPPTLPVPVPAVAPKIPKRGAPAIPNPVAMLPKAPRSHDNVPEPIEHAPIVRDPRDMLDPIDNPMDTVVDAATGNRNNNIGTQDTNIPDPLRNNDNLVHTNSEERPGSQRNDFTVGSDQPKDQLIHDNSQTNQDRTTKDINLLNGAVHQYQQTRAVLPVGEPHSNHTETDRVIDTPGGTPIYHEHKTEKRKDEQEAVDTPEPADSTVTVDDDLEKRNMHHHYHGHEHIHFHGHKHD
ncbi:hypothetical protein C8R44DRAFT_734266 [Mycena epipterygia]|nr:hypothetical protein C8R44DRAFT_734266 [Mycena epipterygia]